MKSSFETEMVARPSEQRIATWISSTEPHGPEPCQRLVIGDPPGSLLRPRSSPHAHPKEHGMQLGAFSISLAVSFIALDPDGNPVLVDQHV
jgi:hypothetical protein